MPRRSLLTPAERASLLAFPTTSKLNRATSGPCRGEDTKRNLKHAKRLRRSYVPGCGAAEIDLDRGSAMFPSGNRR